VALWLNSWLTVHKTKNVARYTLPFIYKSCCSSPISQTTQQN